MQNHTFLAPRGCAHFIHATPGPSPTLSTLQSTPCSEALVFTFMSGCQRPFEVDSWRELQVMDPCL